MRRPFVVASVGLAAGALAVLTKWLYVHPTNPAAGTVLSLLSDFVPMAIAMVGIIMSYLTPKKEHHLRTTLILVVAGLCGTGVMSLNRTRNDAVHRSEMDGLNAKLQSVGVQNAQILNGFVTAKPLSEPASEPARAEPTESSRRRNVLALLRNEYILSNDNLSPALIAGTDQLPAEWLNTRLKQLGEKWTVRVPEPADIGAVFVHADQDVAILLVNRSHDTVMRDPKFSPGIWDLDALDSYNPLPIPAETGDYIRPQEGWGPNQFIGVPGSLQRIKAGDRLFGFVTCTCSNCVKSRLYWVYIEYKSGGWFAEEARPVSLDNLAKSIPAITKDSQRELEGLVPERDRVKIQ
ncbi:MAG: hypothetical protein WB949_12605 [Candidatus Acidiferrales bacterium]